MSLSMKAMGKRFGLLAALLAALLIACTGVVLAQKKSPSSTGGSAAAPGTTIEVTTQEDEDNTDGDCSLREAIKAANTNAAVDGCAAGSSSERDAIHFALGEKATITLGLQLPGITDGAGLTINGQKAKIKVSGDDKVGVFDVFAFVGSTRAKLNLNHLTVADGKAEGASGGGLLNDGGEVKVRNSTFSGNSSQRFGGGIVNFGTLEVTNSTFSGNSAPNGGGGIANAGTLEVTNSTFSGNSATRSGGGIHNEGSTTLKNTIVANSTEGGNCSPRPLIDGGYNIEDGTTCGFSAANNSMPSTESLLADSLAKNGGPTKTIALLEGSPAINAIPNATNGCGTQITTDQRGVSRPQGSGCDIGAFEREQP